MKSILKKAILPVAVFGIAIAAAFATNNVKKEQAQPIYTGTFYYQDLDEYDCMDIEVNLDCTLVNSGVLCTWQEGANLHNVYAKEVDDNSYSCSIPLYKRTVP
ncbi:DUF6520 family protein [Myroides indicus]|uniref:Secreted protein n=1 Tax=Myroides indicus TaxID=1323422 RepID=A0A4R7ESE9_9FLAO|nr:DUF6520 family protein [Myroides indicus]TDS56521.1 hypothetical protein C8P70_12014 [Myroides indicus]